MIIRVTKDELLACKRVVVVLKQVNEVAVATLKEKDALAAVKADLLTLVKVLRKLEEVAT
jgi:hypothetical protein